jgi:hypothetical protein
VVPFGNLEEHTENLRNTLGTWWEHIGNFKNSKDPNTALSLKENKLGFLGAYYITLLAE